VVIETLTQLGTGRPTGDRSVVLAVDGRSSSGKTTLARRMQAAVAGSAVVHTDDIAWWHSRFGWADLLIDGILMPVHRGEPVTFRPPRWAEHGREGSIEVPASCPLLLIEGVGAGRYEAAHLIDALVWVQSDQQEAARRSLARVGSREDRRPSGTCVSGWPRRSRSSPIKGPGNARISSLPVLRRSPSIPSPSSLSRHRHLRQHP
jgi:hypothetical protein